LNVLVSDATKKLIDSRRIFWALVFFEVITLAVFYFGDAVKYGDPFFYVYYAGIIVTPVLLILTPVEPTIGLLLMLVATGLDFLGRIYEGSESVGFNFTYFHVALLVTFVSTFLSLALKSRVTIRSIDLWPPLILYYFVLSYSLIYTPDFSQGSYIFVRIVVMGLISLIVLESVDRLWKVRLFVWGLVLIPLGISILTLYQMSSEGSFYSPNVSRMATSLGLQVYRSTGTFDNPNKLACFLFIGIIIPFGLLFERRQNLLTRLVLIGSLLLSSIGILSTFSRAGWVSVIAGLGVVVAMHRKWSFFAIFFGVIAVLTLILSIKFPQLREVIFDRFTSIFSPAGDDSSSARISLIKSGFWMWQDHPLFGVGLRGFPKMYYDYVDPNMPQLLIYVNEPHTIQSEILAEEGLIGLVVATWLFVTIFVQGFKTSFSIANDYLRIVQIATTSLYVAFIVNFTFATDMTNNTFWMIIGLMYALPFVDKELQSERTEPAESASVVS